jgi:hypothetical protein
MRRPQLEVTLRVKPCIRNETRRYIQVLIYSHALASYDCEGPEEYQNTAVNSWQHGVPWSEKVWLQVSFADRPPSHRPCPGPSIPTRTDRTEDSLYEDSEKLPASYLYIYSRMYASGIDNCGVGKEYVSND